SAADRKRPHGHRGCPPADGAPARAPQHRRGLKRRDCGGKESQPEGEPAGRATRGGLRAQQALVKDSVHVVWGTSMNGTLAYLSLKDGTVHERRAPDDLYVEGWTVEGRFHPEGHVQGDGVFAHDGEPGWLELADGRFYPATAART